MQVYKSFKIKYIIIFIFLFVEMNMFSQNYHLKTYNIHDYGAKDDTTFLSTNAVQKTIDDCHKNGGGVVLIPSGKFVIGTIVLKSNVTLLLEASAQLLGSTALRDYSEDIHIPVEAPRFSKCMIYAEGETNISIEGKGTINGRGLPKYFPGSGERPMHIRFVNCTNVLIRDVKIMNSASWSTHLVSCERIRIEGVYFYNRVQYNNDGIDFDSCKDLFISNCKFDTEDDPICGKSTTDDPTENIVVTNCVIKSTCSGFKLGTSSKGVFRNITFSNCIINDTERGAIKLICVDGGTIENINISNVIMNNVEGPIFIRLGGRGKTYEAPKDQDYSLTGVDAIEETPIGEIKNININNIQAFVGGKGEAQSGMMITGIPGHYVEDIRLRNISIIFPGGGVKKDAQNIIAEDIRRYPEQSFFGILPAYGLYARHARNITMHNCSLIYKNKEERPVIFFDDVQESDLFNVVGMTPQSEEPFIKLTESFMNRFERIYTYSGDTVLID